MGEIRELFRDALVLDIAHSSRQINKSLNNIEDSVNETNQRLEQLKNDINKQLTAINTELVLQSKILSNIQNVLQNKRKTEAEELKKFGIFALQNNWFNEAEEDFIESLKINKYDYQVYFMLSKIFGTKNNNEKQIEYLNKSLKYSIDDVDFQQFVYMDMVFVCIDNSDFETAEILLKKISSIKKSTATCFTSAILDIKTNKITSNTYKNIEDSIDLYESESPARIIEAVDAISTMVGQQDKTKIENLINKSKYKIIKKYSAISFQIINNLVDMLNQIIIDKNFIIDIVPHPMIKKFCNQLSQVEEINLNLSEINKLLENVSISSYDYIVQLPVIYSNILNRIIQYYRLVLDFQEESTIYENSFSCKFEPTMSVSGLANNDNIIIQCELDNGNVLTLTQQNFIISKTSGKSIIIPIEEIDGVQIEKINEKEKYVNKKRLGDIEQEGYFDEITFLVRKKDTEQVLLVDKSLTFTWDYGTRKKKSNMLNLLWSLTLHNNRIVKSMLGIQETLLFTQEISNSYIDFLKKHQIDSNDINDDEVEFID